MDEKIATQVRVIIVLQIELAVEKATRTLTDRKIEENKVRRSFLC